MYICQPPADCRASVYTRAALVLSSIEFDTKTPRECSHRPAVPVSVFGSAPRRVFASPVEASVTPVSPPVILSRLALCSRGGCDAVLRHRARLCFFCTFSAAAIVGFRRRERYRFVVGFQFFRRFDTIDDLRGRYLPDIRSCHLGM